ncbi:MAG: MarR family transcriptional regulator [Chloroflexi bacterium]|nr:MarR family transcriptional regulator [Chloroflexota bacterium]
MRNDHAAHPAVQALLRAYLDAVTLSEPLQGRIWASAQLTLTQVRALRRLASEPKPLGQLGAELGLTPPSMTRVVDRLEERGLIERRRDVTDRRKVVAAILPAGLRLVTSVPLLEESPIRRAAEALPPAARDRIAAALEEFVSAVRSIDGETAPAEAGATR